MKNRRLVFLLAFVILVALGTVACIMVLNVPREEHLATIELPSGDRIIIKFHYRDLESALIGGSGELKYDIYSGQSHSFGLLSGTFDLSGDVRLTHEIQGPRRVKIEEGRYQRRWIFEGDSSGKYEIVGPHTKQQTDKD